MNKIVRHAGLALLLICAGILLAQVLIRPAVGIANNGDFPKMSGPFGLGPERGVWASYPNGSGFIYSFIRAGRYCCYNADIHDADFLSSEYFLVNIAQEVQSIIQPGPRFDIRWLGAVHGLFFLLAIGVWIYGLVPRWRLCVGWLVVLIWTDVAYVQYLNSFYMDTAAMIFLVLCAGAALHAERNRNGWFFPLLTICGATLFGASKAQHAIPALLFFPLFLCFAFWSKKWLTRIVWAAGSLLLLAGSFIVMGRHADQYRSLGVFDMVFSRITPADSDPLSTLQELGLGKDDLPFVGLFSYAPNSPIGNPEWVRQFAARTNYGTLLKYYVHHPSVPIHFLYEDLSGPAFRMRPWGDLSHEDGFASYAQATHFALWSNFRSFLFRRAPWHIFLLILAALAGGVWLLVRSPSDRPFAAMLLTFQTVAIAEYGISVLADSLETERHLFLFHVATDIVILLLPLLFSRIYARRRTRAATAPLPIT